VFGIIYDLDTYSSSFKSQAEPPPADLPAINPPTFTVYGFLITTLDLGIDSNRFVCWTGEF
jgi:hypothetical protein